MKVEVHGNINIKRRIVVNGREYATAEELPPDLRQAYEQAMAGAGGAVRASGTGGVKAKVVFDGREYVDVDSMPEEARRLYETAVEAARATGHGQSGGTPLEPGAGQSVTSPSMAPIEVGGGASSPAVRLTIVAFVILVVLGVIYFLSLRS